MNDFDDTIDSAFMKILDKGIQREEITVEEGEQLLQAEGSETDGLLKVADQIRKEKVGETVTYIINRNINFTNICKNSCKFCAFSTNAKDPESYTLSKEEVSKRTQEAVERGATEICFQGGINPSLTFQNYIEYLQAIRDASQDIHIHAYSPAEINHMNKESGLSIRKTIQKLKEAGLNSVPGTAAEILVKRVRKIICPNKIGVNKWEKIIKTCHELGVPTTATIMYGHVETTRETASHLAKLREIQKETDGFTELVPLAFASQNTELGKRGLAKNLQPEDHMKIYAVSRLMLVNQIKNIQTSWVKLGPKLAQRTLNAGANDFSGTLMEENITRAAGGKYQKLEPEEIRSLINEVGRTPVQRTTTYGFVSESF